MFSNLLRDRTDAPDRSPGCNNLQHSGWEMVGDAVFLAMRFRTSEKRILRDMRQPRILQSNYCYHVTVRCNNREFRLTRREFRQVLVYVLAKCREKFGFKRMLEKSDCLYQTSRSP